MIMNNLKEIQTFWPAAHDFAPLPPDYPTWSGQQKQAFLWNDRILKSIYEQNPPIPRIDIVGLLLTVLRTKMDRLEDEAPSRWRKAIHAHGSVAKIKFVPADDHSSSYTGLFKGADYGLIRASLTGDPGDRNFAPGLAIKLFVDGQPSGNFSALVSLSGQGQNYNFFAHEFSNIVPVVNELGPRITNLIFRRVTKHPTRIYLQHLGAATQQGQPEEHPDTPAQVFLVPNPDLQFAESPHDFRTDLATLDPGTQLFSVYAVHPSVFRDDAIETAARQQAQYIGHIETTSTFVTSFYGDSQLFFRHQRFQNQ
jgi:hypothetical protein